VVAAVRSNFVSASVILALAVPCAAAAQSGSEAAMRRNLDDPGEAVDTFLISSVRGMLASTFDSALPPVSIDDWLFVALAPKIDIPRQRSTSWTTTFCPDRQSAIPGPGAELCVEAGIPTAPDRTVHILFAVAKLVVTGSARAWRRTDASVRDIYV